MSVRLLLLLTGPASDRRTSAVGEMLGEIEIGAVSEIAFYFFWCVVSVFVANWIFNKGT